LHGIQTLLRSTQPSALVPALDQFVGPRGKLDDCPCTDRKYKILHTNFSSRFFSSRFDAKIPSPKSTTIGLRGDAECGSLKKV
jgi:hypothetical protein